MKTIVRKVLIAVSFIGVLVAAFLIVFLPTTTEINISGTFVDKASGKSYEELTKTPCTIQFTAKRNLIGNANRADGILIIGDKEYELSHFVGYGEDGKIAVRTVESLSKSSYFPIDIEIDTKSNKATIKLNYGKNKAWWYGVIEKEEDFDGKYVTLLP